MSVTTGKEIEKLNARMRAEWLAWCSDARAYANAAVAAKLVEAWRQGRGRNIHEAWKREQDMGKQEILNVRNAVIKRAQLGFEDHGILSSMIELDYGGSGQGFGGYALGPSDGATGHPIYRANYAAMWIVGVLRAAEVDEWSKLPGRTIRVRADGEFGPIVAIGHIIRDDRWFDPKERFDILRGVEKRAST